MDRGVSIYLKKELLKNNPTIFPKISNHFPEKRNQTTNTLHQQLKKLKILSFVHENIVYNHPPGPISVNSTVYRITKTLVDPGAENHN